MEAKIQKKARPFLLVLLMIALSIPAVAQRPGRGSDAYKSKRFSDYNDNKRNQPVVRNRNFRAYSTPARFRRGYVNYNRPRVVRTVINPIGHRQRFLPNDVIRFRGNSQVFFFSCGNFYQQTPHGYRTIHAPLGARITELPRRARSVVYNRDVFYQLDNILLSATVNHRGRVIYEVVGYV